MRCVLAQHYTIRKALRWRSAMEDKPPYQRESAVWSLEKQQLFIDSILNGYDVPKIYLHDLRGVHPTKVYAIVDGKQRLTTLWSFLTDGFPLADTFKVEARNLPELPDGAVTPRAGQRFSEFDPAWKEVFEGTFLSVVLIRNATEEDIEDLFSRLNNGEPLNAAEKRNAMGGTIARLVRELVAHPFFRDRAHFGNGRLQHHELATRMLAIEAARAADGALPDLRTGALDAFVTTNRRLPAAEASRLRARTEATLDVLAATFRARDPLLGSPAQALVDYLFVREQGDRSAGEASGDARSFFEWFDQRRREALELPEDQRSQALVEFAHLSQHGTNEQRNIERRLEILRTFHRAWVEEAVGAGRQASPAAAG